MSIVRDFERAFNRREVNALLDCFTEDARYYDNFYGAHSGQARLRKMFERMFHEGRDAWRKDAMAKVLARRLPE
jgi:ketosteroid isomerase-like protein